MKGLKLKTSVFLSVLILFSCQNDLDEKLESVDSAELETKSVVTDLPQPYLQLEGIPITIKSVNNQRYPFLSARPDNNVLNLHNEDDGSFRQRWYMSLRRGEFGNLVNIKVAGNAYRNGYIATMGEPGNYYPRLLKEGQAPLQGYGFQNISNSSYYYITYTYSPFEPLIYLCAESNSSKNLKFMEQSQANVSGIWEISPVGNFKVIDVKYYKEPGDRVDSSFVFKRDYEFDNRGKNTPIRHEFNVSEEMSETSTFGEVTGISMTEKVSMSASLNVGIPVINGKGEISSETTSSKSWTYTTTETKTKKRSFSDKVSVEIPANTLAKLRVYLVTYEPSVTYIATMEEIPTGKRIRLKGKWSGTVGSKLYYGPIGTAMEQPIKIGGNDVVNFINE